MFLPQVIRSRRGHTFRIWSSISKPNVSGSTCIEFKDRSETQKLLNDLIIPPNTWAQLAQSLSRPQLNSASSLDQNRIISELLLSNRIKIFQMTSGIQEQRRLRSGPSPLVELPTKTDKLAALGPHSYGTSTIKPTWFKWCLLDEVGEGVSGIGFDVVVDGEHRNLTSDQSGIIKIENVTDRFALASFTDVEQLFDELEPRWESFREGELPSGEVQKNIALAGEMDKLSLKFETEHQVVITPKTGMIFVELWDKCAQAKHANCQYTIEGMQAFSGTTDDDGRLKHKDVRPGQYTLTLTVTFFEETDYKQTNQYIVPLLVLESESKDPQIRLVGSIPFAHLSRVKGSLFETNKSFLLPSAMGSINNIRETYLSLPPSDILITGHTDTTADASVNDPLSEERAKVVQAFLKDDVNVWLDMYALGLPSSRRWQEKEDRYMIQSLPDFSSSSGDLVAEFQAARGLTVDGKAGTETRTQLITEYMALDGAPLSEVQGFELNISILGCGEDFPLDETGNNLDENPEDEKEDALDRRVDFLFFNKEFGILPKPEKGNKSIYNNWTKQSLTENIYTIPPILKYAHYLDIPDTFFRSNSSMMLPSNESLLDDENVSPIQAMLEIFSFIKKYPNSKILCVGHTDSIGSASDNKKLSEQRAQFVYSLISGDKSTFQKLANSIDRVEDWKQVLKWVSKNLVIVPVLPGSEKTKNEDKDKDFKVQFLVDAEGFDDCDPGVINSDVIAGEKPLKAFQRAFNKNKANMSVKGEDIAVDGIMGEKTWGAIFDCYQYVFASESKVSLKGLEALRSRIKFLETSVPYVGFGELFPRSGSYKDNVKCVTDRRVEVILFHPGQEPDIELLNTTPEATELYGSKSFKRTLIPFGHLEKVQQKTTVRNVQLFGMIFDANKCFLLPQALPGVRDVIAMHKEHKKDKVLIVGHDGGDEDFKGVEIARCRAQIVGQYLTSDFEAWTKWFTTSKPAHVRWGVREVQLMLSVLPESGQPHYIGVAAGIYNSKTIEAVKAFQKYNGSLTIDGKPGPKTQKELIKAYMGLEDTTLTQDIAPVAHGCEGKFEDKEIFEKGIHPDSRVLEVMFFEERVVPRPKKSTSVQGDDEYFEWKKQVVETKFFQFHGLHIQIIDNKKKPVKFGKVIIEGPVNRYAHTDDQGFAFFSGLYPGDYKVSAIRDGKIISSSSLSYPTSKIKYRAI